MLPKIYAIVPCIKNYIEEKLLSRRMHPLLDWNADQIWEFTSSCKQDR
ncbi:5174_t:CDS:2 [Cetraspora pellucida]|uniref:5174_t:CDS:1 n=1 Tax=Cetraspora pellucida TaxID=1433469 RepID=A0A9N9E9U7_9GLOM|nr:5174_t:CDS:2 [Cetraspora pellucida]